MGLKKYTSEILMPSSSENSNQHLVSEVSRIVSEITGIQLGKKQDHMVASRLSKRLLELNLRTPTEYIRFFNQNVLTETQALISLLTTHHSYFFREFSHFEFLKDGGLKRLVDSAQKSGRTKLRFWSAGCSRGQEVYSLAMFLDVHLKRLDRQFSYEILGTDVDPESIAIAKNGVFTGKEIETIPALYLGDHWVQGTGEISHFVKIKASLKAHCKFYVENLLSRPKTSGEIFDVVFCRNVFIYFSAKQVFDISTRFFEMLHPNGLLFLGISESLHGTGLKARSLGPSIYITEISQCPSSIASAKNQIQESRSHKTRVLIVDDSKTICDLLTKILLRDPSLEVIGATSRPLEVLTLVGKLKPDVITMDIHMPEMDGCALVKKLMDLYPTPIVMITAVSIEEGPAVLTALENGAVDYVQKPSFQELEMSAANILEKVRGAARANILKFAKAASPQKLRSRREKIDFEKIIAIGASTGGTEALRSLLTQLPPSIPPILVVQHIPSVFSLAFARRLAGICPFEVKEAEDGDLIQRDRVLIAPGGLQMEVVSKSRQFHVSVKDSPAVNRHKPSVDVLFNSVAHLVRGQALGVILTGMGADGAEGLLKMRRAGAQTIAQSERSCVVFGMPKEAIQKGAAEAVVDLEMIPKQLLDWLKSSA